MSQFTVSRGALPADQYTIVTNDFQRGKLPVPVRCVARCLLGYLLSLPAAWDMDRVQLDASVVEGRDAVDSGLKELERAGYLQRVRWHDTRDGTWRWSWRVTDDPIARPLPAPPSPDSQGLDVTSGKAPSPQVGPSPGNPGAENQGISEDGVKKTDRTTTAAPAGTARQSATPALQAIPDLDPEQSQENAGTETPAAPRNWSDSSLSVNKRATLLAQDHYDRVRGMANMGEVISHAKAALNAGYPAGKIDAAFRWFEDNRWTVTRQKLRQFMEGGPRKPSGPPPVTRPATDPAAGSRPANARPYQAPTAPPPVSRPAGARPAAPKPANLEIS